jgi:hypothetical protein
VVLGEDSDLQLKASKKVRPLNYKLNSAQNAKLSPRMGWGSGKAMGWIQGPKTNKTPSCPSFS